MARNILAGILLVLLTTPFAGAQPTDMVNWWKADGNANDSAGGANGSISGSVVFVAGRYGQAFDFNGGGVRQSNRTVGNFRSSDFSIAFWIRGEPTASRPEILIKGGCTGQGYYAIRGEGPNGSASISFESVFVNPFIRLVIPQVLDDSWHHVIVRRKGVSTSAARDGVTVAVATSPSATDYNTLSTIRFSDGYCVGINDVVQFSGLLDDIRFYNRFLTDQEIRSFACATDMNGDLLVDDADFSIFVVQYDVLLCSEPTMPFNCVGDFNQDGQVDDTDFTIFTGEYDQLVCP